MISFDEVKCSDGAENAKENVIDLREEKNDIVDEKNIKSVDLRSPEFLTKKRNTKKDYEMADNEIKVLKLDNDIVTRLISNNKGVFVDIRKYYKGFPTRRGIRILGSTFRKIAQILDDDIIKTVPDSK